MTKAKTTKRALLTSVLSMMLCMAMLVGSTFAWFTDSVTSGVNKIVAGNLDIELKYQNASMTSFEEVKADTEDLFVTKEGGVINWEPGAAAVTYLELRNAGTLALKYQLSVDANDTVTGSDGAALSKVLKTAVVEIDEDNVGTYTRETAIAAAEAADAQSVLNYIKPGVMENQGDTLYLAMIVYFPKEIENTYDGALYNRKDVELKTELSLNLVATQTPHEEDSFGNNYDVIVTVTSSEELKEALLTAENGAYIYLKAGEGATAENPTVFSSIEIVRGDISTGGTMPENITVIGADNVVFEGLNFHIIRHANETHPNKAPRNLTFRNVHFDKNGVSGLYDLPANLKIENCTFTNAANVNFQSAVIKNSLTVQNCTFDMTGSAGKGAARRSAIYVLVADSATLTIKENTINNADFNAVHVENMKEGGVCVIEGNTLTNGGDKALRFDKINGAKLTVTKNTISNHADDGGEVIKATNVSDTAVVVIEENTYNGKALVEKTNANGTIIY